LKEDSAGVVANVINSRQLILNARRELEIARRLRMQALQYLRETETRARSEAQRLILQARMTIRKEIEDLIRQANQEIQKTLVEIRVIRVTAREELAAQKKFTDAARLRSFTLSLQEEEIDAAPEDAGAGSLKKPSNNQSDAFTLY
jgi:vacuolar-type H+-ATPase subunit H